MTSVVQSVVLKSDRHFGSRVPPHAFGEILRLIPVAVRQSIRMAFEGRSRAAGTRPSWLQAAADIRFVDHTGDDDTILHFEAPRLGDAAGILYEQKELWPSRPDANDTGFDLLGDVVCDIAAGNADSERFDAQLLDQIVKFKHGIDGSFREIAINGSRSSTCNATVVDSTVIATARGLSRNTPDPQQARIAGKLDMIRASTQSFALKLSDGEEVRGVLCGGDVASLTDLFGQDVLVFGRAVYRPSGKLLRIDAEGIQKSTGKDEFFATIPKGRRPRFDLRDVLHEQKHKKGLAAIMGKWPGTETDEEIEQALRELS
jgi:hypothetical protein